MKCGFITNIIITYKGSMPKIEGTFVNTATGKRKGRRR
jgi:hypothetical protein